MLGSAVKNKVLSCLRTKRAACCRGEKQPFTERVPNPPSRLPFPRLLPGATPRQRPWGSVCRLSSRQHAHPALKERPPAPLLLPCPEPWRTLPVCRGAAVPEPCRLGNPDAGPCSQFWRLEAHRQVPGGAVSGTPAARPVAVCLTDTASRASQITDSPAAKP
ncbi:uncharacterized protein LOC116657485 isoform X6 [Camelus ferus]|uniref:Uncharacterized protein LOC116657485 isoform X6 n=1 Tax=Camelus ferus TaxID=419612 RepID=A0A8B8RCK1_CAMFR|nr:uncharacterized protein LOC116657485 isoform X6 [Camelus ferus]